MEVRVLQVGAPGQTDTVARSRGQCSTMSRDRRGRRGGTRRRIVYMAMQVNGFNIFLLSKLPFLILLFLIVVYDHIKVL
jgi:hypothetical protein